MHAKMAHVASLIGFQTYTPDEYRTMGTFTRNDGVAIHVNIGGYQQKDRLSLSGSYGMLGQFLRYLPSNWQGKDFVKEKRGDSITIADTKTAEQIAKDIKVRLLPVVESETAQARINHNNTHGLQSARYAAMQPMADLLDVKMRTDENKASRGEDRPSISEYTMNNLKVETDHDGLGFSISLGNLSAEKAAAILLIIKG
jgi:hypothetical protein